MELNIPLQQFISSGDPVSFARDCLGFKPDASQARVLTAGAQRVLLACHRQFGKSITAAGTAGSTSKGGYNVPKVDLMETLARVFEAGRLEISTDLADAEALKGELLGLRRHGNQYEPHSSLGHDALVMALALSVWRVTRHRKDLLQPPPDVFKRPA